MANGVAYNRLDYAGKGAGGGNGSRVSLKEYVSAHVERLKAWQDEQGSLSVSEAGIFVRAATLSDWRKKGGGKPDSRFELRDKFLTECIRAGIPLEVTARFPSQWPRSVSHRDGRVERAEKIRGAFASTAMFQARIERGDVPLSFRFQFNLINEASLKPVGLAVGYRQEDVDACSLSAAPGQRGLVDHWIWGAQDPEAISFDTLKEWFLLDTETRQALLKDWAELVPSEAFA